MSSPVLEAAFPRLASAGYRLTSEPTTQYNCIAWAAGQNDRWWWPDDDSYWPAGVPREETIEAFTLAFEQMGYSTCASAILEYECEKVALFADHAGVPTHASRQLPTGQWTSKCGRLDDIEHASLEAIGGAGAYEYGDVVRIMSRRK
jgi:hypothetical protein